MWSPFGLPQTQDPNAAAMTSILNVPPPLSFSGGDANGSAKGSAFVSVGANKSPSRSAPFFGGAGAKGSVDEGALVRPEKIGSNNGGAGAGVGVGANRSPPAKGSASKSGGCCLGGGCGLGGENWPKGAGRGGVVRTGIVGGRGGVFGRGGGFG